MAAAVTAAVVAHPSIFSQRPLESRRPMILEFVTASMSTIIKGAASRPITIEAQYSADITLMPEIPIPIATPVDNAMTA